TSKSSPLYSDKGPKYKCTTNLNMALQEAGDKSSEGNAFEAEPGGRLLSCAWEHFMPRSVILKHPEDDSRSVSLVRVASSSGLYDFELSVFRSCTCKHEYLNNKS